MGAVALPMSGLCLIAAALTGNPIAAAPLVVGYALEWFQSWQTPLLIGGGVYILGGVLTLFVNPEKPLESNA